MTSLASSICFLVKPSLAEQIEVRRLPFGFGNLQALHHVRRPALQGLKAKEISNVPGRAASILSSSSSVKPRRCKSLVADVRGIVQRERAHDVLQDVVDLLRLVAQVDQGGRSD